MNSREIEVGDLGPLTPREAETLFCIASGKTAWETATIMGVSESTAVAHIKSATAKLRAANRPHLVSRAFVHGVLRARVLKAGTTLALVAMLVMFGPTDAARSARLSRTRRREDTVDEWVETLPRRLRISRGPGSHLQASPAL